MPDAELMLKSERDVVRTILDVDKEKPDPAIVLATHVTSGRRITGGLRVHLGSGSSMGTTPVSV